MILVISLTFLGRSQWCFEDFRQVLRIDERGVEGFGRAIQWHGAVGLSHQNPFAGWYRQAHILQDRSHRFARTRTVRYMDGPDSSHLEVIAKDLAHKAKL